MKKLFLIAALLLALCLAFPALAQDSEVYYIGEGKTSFLTIAAVASDSSFKINAIVSTDEDNLMDALVNLGYMKVEKASWGYYVTEVLDVKAEGNSYWAISKYDGENFVDLETPIERTPISEGDVYGFVLF